MRPFVTARKAALLLGLAAAAALVASVSLGSGNAAPSAATLSVRIRNHALDLSSHSLPAGRTTIRVTTAGRGEHGIIIARLNDGVTPARFKRALSTKNGLAALSLASFRGGIDGQLTPGRTWQMITDLRPGLYVLADQGESADKPNFDRGSIATLRVSQGSGQPEARPGPSGSIVMIDFAFRIHLPKSFHGRGWVKFENRGHALHRIILLRLFPGVSFAQAYAAVHAHDQRKQGPPPGQPVELIGAVSPGFVGYLNVNLKPGRYIAACFEADSQTGRVPHTELGMIGRFTIS